MLTQWVPLFKVSILPSRWTQHIFNSKSTITSHVGANGSTVQRVYVWLSRRWNQHINKNAQTVPLFRVSLSDSRVWRETYWQTKPSTAITCNVSTNGYVVQHDDLMLPLFTWNLFNRNKQQPLERWVWAQQFQFWECRCLTIAFDVKPFQTPELSILAQTVPLFSVSMFNCLEWVEIFSNAKQPTVRKLYVRANGCDFPCRFLLSLLTLNLFKNKRPPEH